MKMLHCSIYPVMTATLRVARRKENTAIKNPNISFAISPPSPAKIIAKSKFHTAPKLSIAPSTYVSAQEQHTHDVVDHTGIPSKTSFRCLCFPSSSLASVSPILSLSFWICLYSPYPV